MRVSSAKIDLQVEVLVLNLLYYERVDTEIFVKV
jgi:hypothetical protein